MNSSNNHLIVFLSILLLLAGCTSNEKVDYTWDMMDEFEDAEESDSSDTHQQDCVAIPYTEMYGNTIMIPVRINGVGLNMIFDTGASSTCITMAEAQYLYEKGKLSNDDILVIQTFQTADGKIGVGWTVILHEVIIGESIRLNNVEALVVENQQAPLLLGQSVLRNFREVSVDRKDKTIKFYQ